LHRRRRHLPVVDAFAVVLPRLLSFSPPLFKASLSSCFLKFKSFITRKERENVRKCYINERTKPQNKERGKILLALFVSLRFVLLLPQARGYDVSRLFLRFAFVIKTERRIFPKP